MMPENFAVNLQRAIAAKEKSPGYCTVTVEDDWRIKVYAHPDGDKVHESVAALTPLTGKMVKRENCGTIDFYGIDHEIFETHVVTPEACKILGYKVRKVQRPKVVTLDEYEEVEERTAITDCAIRQGKFSESDIEVPAC